MVHVYYLSLEKIISYLFHTLDENERNMAPKILLATNDTSFLSLSH